MERQVLLLKRIAIIGGGLGGLSSAIYLASSGYNVQLFEKNEHFGGKMMSVDLDGYHFDFGPNTITMPNVFQDVLSDAGLVPDQYFTFNKLETHTRNTFPDGISFDFSTSQSYMVEQLMKLDPNGARKYPTFLKSISTLFQLSQKYFLHRTFQSWQDYLSPSLGNALIKVRPHQSIHEFFSQYFENPKVIQALDRYSTYIGSDPFVAPATFAMIAYLELIDGVYYTNGGNTNIAKGFVKAAKELGVELYNNQKVEKLHIEQKKVTGIELENGEMVSADEVIVNGDLLKAYPDLVQEKDRPQFSNKKVREYEPSISGFVILAGLEGRIDALHHHHVFFSNNYKKEFRQIKEGTYADEPTIYICTSSKEDVSVSPNGDNCFILVNAPAVGKDGELGIDPEAYKQKIYKRLKTFGIDIESQLKFDQIWTPKDISSQFGAFRGSIYGPAANRKKDAFLRPYNRSQDIHNLYFAGGSTHPGGGSPMVVLSGKNVAKSIISKHKKA